MCVVSINCARRDSKEWDICNKMLEVVMVIIPNGNTKWGNILGFHVKEEDVKQIEKQNNLGIDSLA
jgi:hypothetical protein